MPSNPGRPKLWHDECKPAPENPKRLIRRCPGCGEKHTVERGYNSAFHKGGSCKKRYIDHLLAKKHDPSYQKPVTCGRCGEEVHFFKYKMQRKRERCAECLELDRKEAHAQEA